MTLKKSMQKLYLKLVGEATDKNNIAKIISDLADNYSGGGGGSGSAPLVTNVEWTVAEHGEDVGTLDKTWQEIYDAYPNVCVSDDGSKALIFHIGGGGESYGLVTSEKDTYVIDSADGYPHTEFGD